MESFMMVLVRFVVLLLSLLLSLLEVVVVG